jgi:hypothetical protein
LNQFTRLRAASAIKNADRIGFELDRELLNHVLDTSINRNCCGGSIESRAKAGAGFSPEAVPGNEAEKKRHQNPSVADLGFECRAVTDDLAH